MGSSAVHAWGPLVRKNGGLLLCIDTWQGSADMRLGTKHREFFPLSHGSPTTYNFLLDRVTNAGMSDVIFPWPISALAGARGLQMIGSWKIDVAYIDSAHDKGETWMELHRSYALLRPGGLLMGDDYSWPPVKSDVDLFAGCAGLTVEVLPSATAPGMWFVRTPMTTRMRMGGSVLTRGVRGLLRSSREIGDHSRSTSREAYVTLLIGT